MPGRRRVTIATVAREAGRSISTVSAALNNAPGVAPATREEILAVAERLGYQADPRARLMRANHTGVIGVSYFPGQTFQAELIDGLYRAAEVHGHELGLSAATPRHGELDGIRALVRERCEAIIVVDSRLSDEELAKAAGNIPLLMLCRDTQSTRAACVGSQDEAAITDLVNHVVATGRHDLVYIDGGESSSSDLRTEAFTQAVTAHGLPVRILPGGDRDADGVRAVEELAAAHALPEAILAYNDHAAIGALLELRRRGIRVPQDIAVAGFDDIGMTALSAVDLTTVHQDVDGIAEVAIRHLLGVLGCEDPAEDLPAPEGIGHHTARGGGLRLTVPASLVVRSSTAAQ